LGHGEGMKGGMIGKENRFTYDKQLKNLMKTFQNLKIKNSEIMF
jgi:hypothetical protein